MNDSLRECIEELRKYKKKMDAIRANQNKERASLSEYIAKERKSYEEYAEKERRSLEKRLDSVREILEVKKKVKEREADKKIKLMEEEATKLHEKIDSLEKKVVSIRLGDLIEELANVAEISTTDITVDIWPGIIFKGEHTSQEMSELIKQRATKEHSDMWYLKLSSISYYCKKECTFCYEMMINVDLNSRQADGKTLLEHCTVVPWNGHVLLEFDGNYDDLSFNISLSYLTIESDPLWCPADLMTQAVINCGERSDSEEMSKDNAKKRSRILSEEIKK